mmetsp:Transcript_25490/g.56299  ORF Transcript_25490/g.56299 Transcript_25490/m.56299 type:complete len:109 (-) Transcript_25490:122-448(-)
MGIGWLEQFLLLPQDIAKLPIEECRSRLESEGVNAAGLDEQQLREALEVAPAPRYCKAFLASVVLALLGWASATALLPANADGPALIFLLLPAPMILAFGRARKVRSS